MNLTTTQRTTIYCRAQKNFYNYKADNLEEWFSGSSVPQEILELIRPYVYSKGKMIFFADTDLVFSHVRSPNMRILLQRQLYRTPTLSIRLKVRHQNEFEQLMAYWDKRDERDEIETLLRQLCNRVGGASMDIVYLLPLFARSRLYNVIFE
jgi:hypothetical protein